MTQLPTPREPEPIRGTKPAAAAYSVVKVIRARIEIARRIQRDVESLAKSDATLDEHVREWARRIAAFEGQASDATEQARRIAEGGT